MIDHTAIKKGLQEISNTHQDVANAIAIYGLPEPRIRPPGFRALLNIIGSQQISTHAAAAILGRIDRLMAQQKADNDAEAFLSLADLDLRKAGFSARKITYGRGIAEAWLTGVLATENLQNLSDEDVIAALIKLKGLGRWSAEIYCLFSLGRSDIFPADDLALLEALKRLKGFDRRPTPKFARTVMAAYAPYRSVMSIFLWHYYKGAPP